MHFSAVRHCLGIRERARVSSAELATKPKRPRRPGVTLLLYFKKVALRSPLTTGRVSYPARHVHRGQSGPRMPASRFSTPAKDPSSKRLYAGPSSANLGKSKIGAWTDRRSRAPPSESDWVSSGSRVQNPVPWCREGRKGQGTNQSSSLRPRLFGRAAGQDRLAPETHARQDRLLAVDLALWQLAPNEP